MKIRIQAEHGYYFGQDVLDYFVAEYQWRANYNASPDIQYGEPDPSAVNIAFVSMPEHIDSRLDQSDIILLDNVDEAFGRGTQALYDIFDIYPQSYLACNSYLHKSHHYYAKFNNRILNTMIAWSYHRRFYTEPAFPTSLEYRSRPKDAASMIYINGRNRSWREYITRLLKQNVSRLPHHNVMHNDTVTSTKFCWFEDPYDTVFREKCNTTLANDVINANPPENQWPPLPAGVSGRFGQIEFQDRFIDAFRNNAVIVFPETTWQNNILALNEKCLRCFMHQRWAMPFGGANMHSMLQDIGFYTAWYLLPPELQLFDKELDHEQRWAKQCAALNWLLDNPEVFNTTMARTILLDNHVQSVVHSSSAGHKLYEIIDQHHVTQRKRIS